LDVIESKGIIKTSFGWVGKKPHPSKKEVSIFGQIN
jgi:hypothetical protein